MCLLLSDLILLKTCIFEIFKFMILNRPPVCVFCLLLGRSILCPGIGYPGDKSSFEVFFYQLGVWNQFP